MLPAWGKRVTAVSALRGRVAQFVGTAIRHAADELIWYTDTYGLYIYPLLYEVTHTRLKIGQLGCDGDRHLCNGHYVQLDRGCDGWMEERDVHTVIAADRTLVQHPVESLLLDVFA